MNRLKAVILLSAIFLAQNLFAQVDTITFRFLPDIANTFKLRCQAQKVNFSGTDTILMPFELSDTVNGAYTFDWGGTIEPQSTDDIPLASYEFTSPGINVFSISIYEDATGKTYTDSKTFEIRDIIRVPNVFTPNDDGINDLFIVRANGIDVLEISIYSRTGTIVYSERAPIIVWNGRNSSGSVLSAGIYYYVLKSEKAGVPAQNGFFYIFDPAKK
ncbi:gliding motility-associated C-terminal domain-containing protein [Bacteroidota bacterium]